MCIGYSVARLSGSRSHPSPGDRGFFRPPSLHAPHEVLNTLPSSPIQHAPSLSTYCAPTAASAPVWRKPEAGGRNGAGAVLVLALRVRGTRWAVGQEGQEPGGGAQESSGPNGKPWIRDVPRGAGNVGSAVRSTCEPHFLTQWPQVSPSFPPTRRWNGNTVSTAWQVGVTMRSRRESA